MVFPFIFPRPAAKQRNTCSVPLCIPRTLAHEAVSGGVAGRGAEPLLARLQDKARVVQKGRQRGIIRQRAAVHPAAAGGGEAAGRHAGRDPQGRDVRVGDSQGGQTVQQLGQVCKEGVGKVRVIWFRLGLEWIRRTGFDRSTVVPVRTMVSGWRKL